MIETFRSIVHPWECDTVDHFTTAFYYRAFGVAGWQLLRRLGCGERDLAGLRSRSCRTRFTRELRAGDPYHLVSGVIEATDGSVRLGHRLINSETGEPCASHAQDFSAGSNTPDSDLAIEWHDDGPMGEVDFDAIGTWSRTAGNAVQPHDLDESGRMSLSTLIHYASDANVQLQNRIGMTSSYMREHLIGFATMGYEIGLEALPREVGTAVEIVSAPARLGRSSLWMAHRVVDGRTQAPIARVAQFGVHFDRRARRPAEIPAPIRSSVEALLSRAPARTV